MKKKTFNIPNSKELNAYCIETNKFIKLCCKSKDSEELVATYDKDKQSIFINGNRKNPNTALYRSFKHYIESRYNLVTPEYIFYEHFRDEKFKEPRHFITPLGEAVYYSPFHTEFHDCFAFDEGDNIYFVENGYEIASYRKDPNVILCNSAYTSTLRQHFTWFADMVCHITNSEKMTVYLATYDRARTINRLNQEEIIDAIPLENDDYYEEEYVL